MNIRFTSLIGIFLIVLANFSCNKNDTEIDPNYPTVLTEISTSRASEILDQLAQTPMFYCMSIDTFGFPFFDIYNDTMCINEEWKIDNSIEEIQIRTNDALFEYADLLNIDLTEPINILNIKTTKGLKYEQFKTSFPDSLPNTWLVTTKQQTYNGITVRGTFIEVLLSPDDVIGIRGHWYNFIYVPESEKLSEEDAKVSIYNKSFEYSNSNIIPTESSTWHTSKKIILPIHRSDDQIELHVCWALYPSSWEIIIDIETGEILSTVDINKI